MTKNPPYPMEADSLSARLHDEFHRRPPIPITTPGICRMMVFCIDEASIRDAHTDLHNLCNHLEINTPPIDAREYFAETSTFILKWERHTEFVTYAFYSNPSSEGHSLLNLQPVEWVRTLKLPMLSGCNILITKGESKKSKPKPPINLFNSETVAGSHVCDKHAELWSDFLVGEGGFTNYAIVDHGLGPKRAGRLVQRLMDVEVYRLFAMIGLSDAHRSNAKAGKAEANLHQFLEGNGFQSGTVPDQELLNNLLILASKTEHLLSTSSFRFDATKAYATLVYRRLEELNEQRIQGAQRLANFLRRRFIPAIDTCEAAQNRLQDLTNRIHRDATLIRTRIEIVRQEQNNQLLDALNARAEQQFKIQQTLEAISSVAISYYAISIFAYFAKGIREFVPNINIAMTTGIITPFIVLFVIIFVTKISRKASK